MGGPVAGRRRRLLQAGGLVFALWSRVKLAEDSGSRSHTTSGRPAEVDALLEQAAAAGATIARPGAATFWGGYSSAFHDPDGRAWEIAHNPSWSLANDGSVTL